MIQHSEIKNLETEWGLREDVIEKDYVISWLLWGIGSHPALRDAWIFKGGTCLKKCYFETYRFSEDLDFTVLPKGPFTPDDKQKQIKKKVSESFALRKQSKRLLESAKRAVEIAIEKSEADALSFLEKETGADV